MGFFSSRRADDNDHRVGDTPSVTKVIRSRFYGKGKGKERDGDMIESYAIASRNPNSGMFKQPSAFDSPMRTPSRATQRSPAQSISSTLHSKRKATTDTVTLTLAQRLNELAIANSQGLLNDEEYRLLRQDLFDRLAQTSTPVENPVVPVTPSPRKTTSSSYKVEPQPSPSIRSKGSARSGVTSLLMRVTTSNSRTRSGSQSTFATDNDGTSVMSGSSGSFFKRALHRKGSTSSVGTSDSHPTTDISSPSRHRSGSVSDSPTHRMLRSGSRSQGSMRMLASPPSSFHVQPSTSQSFDLSLLDDENIERLQSSTDIKAAINALEAEKKRLVDSFNSLELSTLTKHRTNKSITDWQTLMEDNASGWTVAPEPRSPRRGPSSDIDATSLQSGLSTSRSALSLSIGKTRTSMSGIMQSSPLLPTTPIRARSRPSLSRQTSNASMASTSTRANRTFAPPPVPSLPTSYSSRSQSSLNLNGNIMVLGSLAEDPLDDNTPGSEQDKEMANLKQRRVEVLKRYDDKAEYLRAKLKGAELREKLMRR